MDDNHRESEDGRATEHLINSTGAFLRTPATLDDLVRHISTQYYTPTRTTYNLGGIEYREHAPGAGPLSHPPHNQRAAEHGSTFHPGAIGYGSTFSPGAIAYRPVSFGGGTGASNAAFHLSGRPAATSLPGGPATVHSVQPSLFANYADTESSFPTPLGDRATYDFGTPNQVQLSGAYVGTRHPLVGYGDRGPVAPPPGPIQIASREAVQGSGIRGGHHSSPIGFVEKLSKECQKRHFNPKVSPFAIPRAN